jgi:TolB-like protein/Tfp pilus assembly protein PilF
LSLINELKRRNVFKVGATYLTLGWVVMEVTGVVVPALHLPESIPSIVMWLGVIGFPFVVIFSWVFELTPEGLKRESEVDRTASITHVTGKRLDYIIIAMLAVAIGLFIAERFLPAGAGLARDDRAQNSSSDDHTQNADSDNRAQGELLQEEAEPAPASVVDDKSIAVLPFEDMSQEKNQEYMSDGIAEELLNLLAKIPELRVIARTSSFAFKDQEVDIADIAKKLNVAHVLEGSIRKSGNTVRITTQLIRTSDSTHVWSESYDRPLDDIFAVQDEIAGAVVEQLKIKLLSAAPKSKPVDPRAYALYLQGRQLDRQGTVASYEQAIALYQQALAIDPGYAEAWSGLAATYNHQSDNAIRPFAEGYPLAREAATSSLAIDAEYAPAHANLGAVAMNFDGDFSASARHFERALALEPANPDIIGDAAYLARSLGRLDDSIALREYAVARDPLNPGGHVQLGVDYLDAGRLDDALSTLRTAAELSPAYSSLHYRIGLALLLKGDAAGALAATEMEAQEGWRLIGLAMAYHALGKNPESDTALSGLISSYEKDFPYNIAYIMAHRGENDRAFEWLDKAVGYRDPGLADIAVEPQFANIRQDPRWLPFLQQIGKAPEQLAAIRFEVTVPR